METSYRTFFGFKKDPFASDLALNEILQTAELIEIKERFDYTIRIGAMALVTGDIGSGKSTALRYATGQLHPSEYATLFITASSGSILEIYRQLLSELGFDMAGTSRAVMIGRIKKEIKELVLGKKMKVVFIIDEASLIRLDVLSELHTLTQFDHDSKPYLPTCLPQAGYPGRTIPSDRQTYVPNFSTPSFKNRGPKPPGRDQQGRYGTIPQTSSIHCRS